MPESYGKRIDSITGFQATTMALLQAICLTLPAMKIQPLLVFCVTALICAACDSPREDMRPNIVLILADDLGYSDIGPFGSEIRTPTLDNLAATGITFTNFHTTPTCGPTRAMLMSGIDPHPVGMAANAAAIRRVAALQGRRGYDSRLNDDAVTVATLLSDAGYQTYMTGKWDLGNIAGSLPVDRGFDKSFILADGGGSHFSNAFGILASDPKPRYFENGTALDALPDDFYSTRTYTERAVEFIEGGDVEKPFFAYVAYTAPHWPLHVPDDWIGKYKGSYDAGWHALKTARLTRQKQLGLFADAPDSGPLPGVEDWQSLSAADRTRNARTMEIYAAMIEYMDWQIGHLLESVAVTSGDRPTLIIFMSDNGPEGNAIGRIGTNDVWVDATFNNDIDNMGKHDSYLWTGPGWAQASAAPFHLYKSFVTEGGIRAPAIMKYSASSSAGETSDAFLVATDIPATILDVAGVSHPGTRYAGREVLPIEGRSALPILAHGAPAVHQDEPLGWELYGNRALVKDQWKAVLLWPPRGDGEWRLYDLEVDPFEKNDLSGQHPEVLEQLITEWHAYADDKGIYLFESDNGYGRY
ncbi:MAG: arylsulfatase [Woeseiaceae bacterium]